MSTLALAGGLPAPRPPRPPKFPWVWALLVVAWAAYMWYIFSHDYITITYGG